MKIFKKLKKICQERLFVPEYNDSTVPFNLLICSLYSAGPVTKWTLEYTDIAQI